MIAIDADSLTLRASVFGILIPAMATAALVILLARCAAPLGLQDQGGGVGLHRAPSGQNLRLVGGLALGLGLALSAWIGTDASNALSSSGSAPWPGIAMITALAIGLADDSSHGGVSARAKLALQVLPALAFALGNDTPLAWFSPLAFVAALAAQNLANTYDNADGVLLATAALALAPARPAWSAIALAVLAFNLRLRGRASVLLGDSGSHLIGLMLVCEPRAWGAFCVPALDLARVVLTRRKQGRGWWLGDRTHLAHRLQARGLSQIWIVVILALAGLPAILAVAFFTGALPWSLGVLGSSLAFLIVVRATPAVDGLGVAVKDARSEPRPAGADRVP